jgi:hypothetical protein
MRSECSQNQTLPVSGVKCLLSLHNKILQPAFFDGMCSKENVFPEKMFFTKFDRLF